METKGAVPLSDATAKRASWLLGGRSEILQPTKICRVLTTFFIQVTLVGMKARGRLVAGTANEDLVPLRWRVHSTREFEQRFARGAGQTGSRRAFRDLR